VKQIKNGRKALRVQRETLRNLSAANMKRVGGGDYELVSLTICCDQFPYNFLPPGTRSIDPPGACFDPIDPGQFELLSVIC
jgi:hypothetical protein